jgi:hypothetical protein
MTKGQREALEIIRANGGYACLDQGFQKRVWSCAGFDNDYCCYYQRLPLLSGQAMDRLNESGLIQPASGCGYSAKSFWEPTP